MNVIQLYLQSEKILASDLAKRLGRPVATVTRLINGQRNASPNLAKEIEEATEGKLKAVDVFAMALNNPCGRKKRSKGESAPK